MAETEELREAMQRILVAIFKTRDKEKREKLYQIMIAIVDLIED